MKSDTVRKLDKAELKCSVCGSTASIRRWRRNNHVTFYVCCDGCTRHTREYEDKRKAVSSWEYFNTVAESDCSGGDNVQNGEIQDEPEDTVIDASVGVHDGMSSEHTSGIIEGMTLPRILNLAIPGDAITRRTWKPGEEWIVCEDNQLRRLDGTLVNKHDYNYQQYCVVMWENPIWIYRDWVFAYRAVLLSFADAFVLMKQGKRLTRRSGGRVVYFSANRREYYDSSSLWNTVLFTVEEFNATDWYVME